MKHGRGCRCKECVPQPPEEYYWDVGNGQVRHEGSRENMPLSRLRPKASEVRRMVHLTDAEWGILKRIGERSKPPLTPEQTLKRMIANTVDGDTWRHPAAGTPKPLTGE